MLRHQVETGISNLMRLLILAVACLFIATPPTRAATVSITRTQRWVRPAEIASDPALDGKVVTNWYLSSSTEILSINAAITINGSQPYQVSTFNGGSDTEPPNPAFVAVIPALGADSWITTPGTTSVAGGGFGNPSSTWFDADSNGPQTNFQFARLTVPFSAFSSYFFRINVVNDDGTAVSSFTFIPALGDTRLFDPQAIAPEPSSAVLVGVSLLALMGNRRRLPTPAPWTTMA